MKLPLTGRADLARVLAAEEAASARLVAAQWGFERELRLPPMPAAAPEENARSAPAEVSEVRERAATWRPAQFWRAETFAARNTDLLAEVRPPPPDEEKADDNEKPPRVVAFEPLASKAEIFTRLRRQSEMKRPGPRLDLDRIVGELSQGRELARLPYLDCRSWGTEFDILIDLSRRLIPYRRDQTLVAGKLRQVLPKSGARIAMVPDGSDQPVIQWPNEEYRKPLSPRPGATILVLGDLGMLQKKDGAVTRARWRRLGRAWRDLGCQTLALVPCRIERVPADLTAVWSVMPWERASATGAPPKDSETGQALDRLLTLASSAIRVEPILLRALRKLFAEGARDSGLEGLFWQEADETDHCTAAAFSGEKKDRFRDRLDQDALAGTAREWIAGVRARPGEFAGLEIAELASRGKDATPAERARVERWFSEKAGTEEGKARERFFSQVAWLFSREAYAEHRALNELWFRLYGDETPPRGYDPGLAGATGPIQSLELRQWGGGLIRQVVAETGAAAGSPLARMRYRVPWIGVERLGEMPGDSCGGWRPPWAVAAGVDQYGNWAEFAVKGTRQRMRWIPPGRFMMGSPEAEEGRFSDEGPRHEESIAEGFWLFDTPCTQALWAAVMGENPSHFRGPQRPVEQVSWEDGQKFVTALNGRVKGLAVRFPREEEWEYAARARTEAARYGELDQVAWYDQNSGGETHEVKGKLPNGWGLYDMLGNVYEWCENPWRDSYAPEHAKSNSALRVIRGGGYEGPAGVARAAYRHWFGPTGGNRGLGFRCSSSGYGPEASEAAERSPGARAEPRGGDGAEPAERKAAGRVKRPSRRQGIGKQKGD